MASDDRIVNDEQLENLIHHATKNRALNPWWQDCEEALLELKRRRAADQSSEKQP